MAKARSGEQPASSASPTFNPRVTPRPRTPAANGGMGIVGDSPSLQPGYVAPSGSNPVYGSTAQGGMSAQMGQPLPTREKQIANEMKMASANRFGSPMNVLMGEAGGQVGAGMGGGSPFSPTISLDPGLNFRPLGPGMAGPGGFPNLATNGPKQIDPNDPFAAMMANIVKNGGPSDVSPRGRMPVSLNGGGLRAPIVPPQSGNIAGQLPPQILQRLQQILAARQGGAPMRTPGLPSNQNPWLMGSALGMGQ